MSGNFSSHSGIRTARTDETAEGMPVAGDLKRILNAIADQLAQEDQRRTELFSGLQERLDTLDCAAKGSALPGETGRERHWSEENFRSGPAPLKSAVAGDLANGAVASNATRPSASRGDIDPFDVIGEIDDDFVKGGPGGHVLHCESGGDWDAAQAEALTRVYETERQGGRHDLSEPFTESAMQDRSVAAGPTAQATVTGGVEPSSGGISQDELGLLFLELADKLDNVVAAMPTDATFEMLDARLVAIEDRIRSSQQDVGSFSGLQDQISDVASHILAAQSQFGRLDRVESELRELAERLSDERLSTLSRGNSLSKSELETISEQISERLGASMLVTPPAKVNDFMGADPTELRDTLQKFIAERREGDEHTVMMLDTMQQALIRLLDRIDEMELDRPSRGRASDPTPAEAIYAAATPLAKSGTTETAAEGDKAGPVRSAAIPQERNVEMALPIGQANSTADAVQARQEPTAPQVQVRPTSGEDKVDLKPAAQPIGSTAQVDAAPTEPLSGRAALVASARRAAQQAAEQRLQAEEAAAAEKKAGRNQKASLANAIAGAKPAGEKSRALSRSPIAVGAVILLGLGIGYHAYNLIGKSSVSGKAVFGTGTIAQPKANKGAMSNARGSSDVADGKLVKQAGDADFDKMMPDQAIVERPAEEPKSLSTTMDGTPVVQAALDGQPVQQSGAIGQGGQDGVAGVAASGTVRAQSKLVLPPPRIGPLSLRLAAANGDPSAEFEVAARFAEGNGIDHDLKEAFAWYQKSASKGFAASQYRLATLYERGVGVSKDLARAQVWYQRAAELGHVKAMHNLGVLSAGTASGSADAAGDYGSAAHWFGQAAEFGLKDSQFNLAILYESGLGVRRDPYIAYKWFAIAAKSGDTEAVNRMTRAKSKLTTEELVRANGEVERWGPRAKEHSVNDARAAGELWKRRSSTVSEAN